jgi:hypothetical protein
LLRIDLNRRILTQREIKFVCKSRQAGAEIHFVFVSSLMQEDDPDYNSPHEKPPLFSETKRREQEENRKGKSKTIFCQ